jgi:tetratricopeptide (TPR) repeat protein
MIERAQQLFPDEQERILFVEAVSAASERQKYQAAMQFVIECRGQPAVDTLIRDAVLDARIEPANGERADILERDLKGWSLRPGVLALGQLIQNFPAVFQRPILTSNFDPLLEIAIRQSGGNAISINLPADGNFSSLVVNDNIAQVVHFHGFWSEENTLHTPETLTRERPLLAGNLQRLLQETVLVVIGYGGWPDVFTNSLLKAVSEQTRGLNVLWTFFSNDHKEIYSRNADLLSSFSRLAGQRIIPYSGVDCHQVFPRLLKDLSRVEKQVTIPVQIIRSTRAVSYAIRGTSNLPVTDAWVGRQMELGSLLTTDRTVLSLYGWGGFGKSSLAARYVVEKEKKGDIEGWYWADCREQGNTMQMHLINVLEFVTQGQVNAISLQKARDEDILDLLFERVGDRKILLIFDNIDHYVDLENQKAIGMMHQLIDRSVKSKHVFQLILTSRPVLNYDSEQFISVPVTGLGANEADELFRLRGAQWDEATKKEQILTVLEITEGSALRLNLIATQVAKPNVSLSALLRRIQEGSAPEVEDRILQEVWAALKPEPQEVLRVLAELPHSESEQRVGQCLSGSMNFNHFHKAVRVLKSLNLIVNKQTGNSGDVLELHPLVRSFIRKRYPKEEQAPFIEQVINFFDRMIGRFRGSPEARTAAVINDCISKIEVCVDNGRVPSALSALDGISRTLLSRGLVEEFIRLAVLVLERYEVPEDPAELQKFDVVSYYLVNALGDLGRYEDADQWIEKLAKTVAGKSARYIWLCNLRAYANWIREDFAQAKRWAAEGVQLKVSSKIDTGYDCSHNLALARRDSGEVEEALNYFLRGANLESVVDPNEIDRNLTGPFYGNIGRCLQFLNKFDDALVCLKKSAVLLETDHEQNHILLNRGWAAMWIGEVQIKKKDFDQAYIAFRSAAGKWKTVSPERAKLALRNADSIVENLGDPSLVNCGDWECEEMYRNWLRI